MDSIKVENVLFILCHYIKTYHEYSHFQQSYSESFYTMLFQSSCQQSVCQCEIRADQGLALDTLLMESRRSFLWDRFNIESIQHSDEESYRLMIIPSLLDEEISIYFLYMDEGSPVVSIEYFEFDIEYIDPNISIGFNHRHVEANILN